MASSAPSDPATLPLQPELRSWRRETWADFREDTKRSSPLTASPPKPDATQKEPGSVSGSCTSCCVVQGCGRFARSDPGIPRGPCSHPLPTLPAVKYSPPSGSRQNHPLRLADTTGKPCAPSLPRRLAHDQSSL